MANPTPGFRSALACCLLAAISVLAGCSHYRLGGETQTAFRTLYVAPVANKTYVPQAEALLSTAIRQEFINGNRVSIVGSPAGADATLTIAIAEYRREAATSRPGDTGLARTFAITLAATATLRDNRADRDLFRDRRIDSANEVYTDSGQLQSEYQNLPILATTLAKRIAHAALDVW